MLGFLLIVLGLLLGLEVWFSTNTYLKLRGRWRLRWGWCPQCASSPPDGNCFVCHGSAKYGPRLSDLDRARWQASYESHL